MQSGLVEEIGAVENKLKLLTDTKPRNPSATLSELPLVRLSDSFQSLLDILQDADVTPSTQGTTAAKDLQIALVNSLKIWNEVKAKDIPALNVSLKRNNLSAIGN